MTKASAGCVETPELAEHQQQAGDAGVIPGRLASHAERQGRIRSRGEPLALRCAEGCAENTSSEMLLKMHYASLYFFSFSLILLFFSESVSL